MTHDMNQDSLANSYIIESGSTLETVDQQAKSTSFLLDGWRLQCLMLGLCLSMLLIGLDFTMVATAVPTITTHFNSLRDVSWYGSSFLISICACQLVAGNLYERFPHKWVYASYVIVFEVGSLVSALSPSSAALIIGRAITGIGASGLFCGSLIVIGAVAPKSRQPVYFGICQGCYVVSEVIGPLVGGAFTGNATWRWCFWINLPIGGVTFVILLLFVNSRSQGSCEGSILSRLKSLDILGFILFSGSVTQLLLALQFGGVKYSWRSSVVIGLFCGFFFTFIAFVLWQIRLGDKACVPPTTFMNQTVFFGSFTAVFGNGAFFVVLYYLQIWFQAVKGASPLNSGIRYLPTVIANILAAVVCGGLVAKLPYHNPLLLFGVASLAIGAGLDTTLQVDSYAGRWIGFQIFCGIGFALLVQIPFVACQRELSPAQSPMGTTIIIWCQAFSAAVFMAVGQPVFDSVLRSYIVSHDQSIDADAVISAGVTGLRDAVTSDQLPILLRAYNHACTRVFFVAVACSILSFLFACGMKWNLQTNTEKAEVVNEEPKGENGTEKA